VARPTTLVPPTARASKPTSNGAIHMPSCAWIALDICCSLDTYFLLVRGFTDDQ